MSIDQIRRDANQIRRELADIEKLLDSSVAHMGYFGQPYLVNCGVSVNMNVIAEKLLNISRRFHSLSMPTNSTDYASLNRNTDRNSGVRIAQKMRNLYIQSDSTLLGRIHQTFHLTISIISTPFTLFKTIFGLPVNYSIRDRIEGDGNYSVGPESVEANFRSFARDEPLCW